MNAAEEAVEEELSCSEELYTTVVLGQDNGTAATSYFVFTLAANIVMDKFSSARIQ